ncbi:MAG: LemA family protein [Pseudomonadota bacterium]
MFVPVVVLIALVICVWAGVAYNGLVRLRNAAENAWSQIAIQLKRRHDLIPNLVESVKGYAGHEKTVFEDVTKARSACMDAKEVPDVAKCEGMLTQALKSLIAVSENYPQLKANENFLSLQGELAATENKISFARQFYNDSVMNFNNKIQMFPSNLIASMFEFKPKDFFSLESDEDKKPVNVSF